VPQHQPKFSPGGISYQPNTRFMTKDEHMENEEEYYKNKLQKNGIIKSEYEVKIAGATSNEEPATYADDCGLKVSALRTLNDLKNGRVSPMKT
jgi:hypothetical protein